MSTSTINLIVDSDFKILRDNNFLVENMNIYIGNIAVSSSTKILVSNFMYIKNGLNIEINVNLAQAYCQPAYATGVKYVTIQNTSERAFYYFVDSCEWRSTSTIHLKLHMDVLNTFINGTDYEISPKSHITREHKNRLVKHGNNYYRKIDYYSEGLNPVLYKNDDDDYIEDNNLPSRDWFLMYANNDDPSESLVNPVSCYLFADAKIKIAYTGGSRTLTYDNLVEGYYYYIIKANWEGTATGSDGNTYYVGNTGTPPYKTFTLCLHRVGSKIYVFNGMEEYSSFPEEITPTSATAWNELTYITFTGTGNITAIYSINAVFSVALLPSTTSSLVLGENYITINCIDDIDRTNAKIIKIIKLPYAPYSISYDTTTEIYSIDRSIFDVDTTYTTLKLKNLNTKFTHTIEATINNPLDVLSLSSQPVASNTRNNYYESKIFHSDFFAPKCVYDSFAFSFALERENINKFVLLNSDHQETLYFTFNMTSTINSRFMFTFSDYEANKLGQEDYNNIMPITRNNEITLYNSAYINYIRTGYNYDVKTRNRETGANWLTFGAGLFGSLLSFASGNPFGIATGVTLATTTLTKLVSTINSTAQSEQNIEAKLNQLKMQSVSVSGADDVDLMSVYAHNRMKYVEYKVSSTMQALLYDLFYYTGYACNEIKAPTLNTRTWFNFIAGDMILSKLQRTLNNEIVEELLKCYHDGVTIFHYYNSTWDIDQVKENAETTIETI